MSHSKRNTSLAFFTAHERALLRGTWGSQSARLSSSSVLPFGHCTLCLLPAVDPVACCGFTPSPSSSSSSTTPADPQPSAKRKRPTPNPRKTHIFCRACALENMLAQKQDLKRLARAAESQAQLAAAAAQQAEQTRAAKELRAFEAAQSGLAGNGAVHVSELGAKRRRADNDERDAEKRARSSFWVPSETPDAGAGGPPGLAEARGEKKLAPVCPGSLEGEAAHAFGMQSLTPVVFTQETGAGKDGAKVRVCPACSKPLNNSSKALLASPCGHVVCGNCADKFVLGGQDDGGDGVVLADVEEKIACFVCGESLVARAGAEVKDKKAKQAKLQRGLLQISCEGTGYAGGGNNMVKRAGVAFQC